MVVSCFKVKMHLLDGIFTVLDIYKFNDNKNPIIHVYIIGKNQLNL